MNGFQATEIDKMRVIVDIDDYDDDPDVCGVFGEKSGFCYFLGTSQDCRNWAIERGFVVVQ